MDYIYNLSGGIFMDSKLEASKCFTKVLEQLASGSADIEQTAQIMTDLKTLIDTHLVVLARMQSELFK